MKKRLWLLVKIVITAVLVYWLIRHVDWTMVAYEIWTLSWPLIALYVVLQFASLALSAKKWQVISEYKGIRFTYRDGLFAYLSGMFINNFLPSTIGGDIYRGLWLARRTDSRAKAFSVILFDRFLGLWMVALLALLGSLTLWAYVWDSALLQLSYAVLLAFFVLDGLLLALCCRPWFSRLVDVIPVAKARNLVRELTQYTQARVWIQGSWWAFLFVVIGLGISNYILFWALGYALPFFQFLSLVFLMAIYVSIPISINNIGLKEWAYVALFGLLGIGLEVAVTAALLSRVIQMFISFLALPVYMAERQRGLARR